MAPQAEKHNEEIVTDRLWLSRIVEAVLFASSGPVNERDLAKKLPDESDISGIMSELAAHYEGRGVELCKSGQGWLFRTAPDLAGSLQDFSVQEKKLSRAALESLSIIAWHQPVTRAEIDDIRGVSSSRGTLEILIQTGWVRIRGRRRSPGKPVTYGITDAFLAHFGLESREDLPGISELKEAGFLDSRYQEKLSGLQVKLADGEAADEDLLDDDEFRELNAVAENFEQEAV